MPSAEEMRELAEEIVASKRSRKEEVESLNDETRALMDELAEGDKSRQMGVKIQLTGYRNDHQAMAKELHASLEADNAALMEELGETTKARKAEVSGLMEELAEVDAARQAEVKSQLSGYRAEMEATRTAWQEGLRAAPPPKPPVKVAPPPPAPPAEVAPPPEPTITVEEEEVPDDLTVIRGIGASMQERLNRHGIVTYAQLAEASPAEIEAMLGDAARLANVEEWIAQAGELAE